MLASSGEGFFIKWRISTFERLIFLVASLALIIPELVSSIIGLGILTLVYTWHRLKSKHKSQLV